MMAMKRVEEFSRLKSSIQEERGGGEQAGAEDSPEVWRALYSMLMMVSPWPLSNLALSAVICFAFYLDMNLPLCNRVKGTPPPIPTFLKMHRFNFFSFSKDLKLIEVQLDQLRYNSVPPYL